MAGQIIGGSVKVNLQVKLLPKVKALKATSAENNNSRIKL